MSALDEHERLSRESRGILMGMVLTSLAVWNEAWNREICLAKLEAGENPTGMKDLCCPEDIDG